MPLVHVLLGRILELRQLQGRPDVCDDLGLWPRKQREDRPSEKPDHRDVMLGDLHAELPQTCEGVKGLGFAEGIYRMELVTILQAILHEALALLEHCDILPEGVRHGVLETPGQEGDVLPFRHQACEGLLVRCQDGMVVPANKVALHAEKGVLVSEVGITQPIHFARGFDELRVVGAIDGETGGQATVWVEREACLVLCEVRQLAPQLSLLVIV
mmetsp:Transcript_8644/g.30921  ORF Transcript_8644/g.30921 Transcript_8644/m.30921 type:complete len:214 (-) Transcript_8644:498-1139(-)